MTTATVSYKFRLEVNGWLNIYIQIHRDDGFELEEYDGKGPSPDDIEILANSRTGTTVQLPAASGATLDDVSLHSTRASIDAK